MNKKLKSFSSIQSIERCKLRNQKIKTQRSISNSPKSYFLNQNKIQIQKLYQKGNSLLKENKVCQINLLFKKCLREGQKVLKQKNINEKYVEVLYRIGEFNYNGQNYFQAMKYLNTCFSLCHKISHQFKNQYTYKTIALTTRCICKLLLITNKKQDFIQKYAQSILSEQMHKFCECKVSSKIQQTINKKYQIIQFFLIIHDSKHKKKLQIFHSLIKFLHKLQSQKQNFINYKKSDLFYIYRETLSLCAFVLQFQGFQKQSLEYYLKTKSLINRDQQQNEYLKILTKIADLKSKFIMSINIGQQKNNIENQLKLRYNFNIHKKSYQKFSRQNKTDIKNKLKNNVNLTIDNQIKPNYFDGKVKESQFKMILPRLQPLFFKEKQYSLKKFQPLKKEDLIIQTHKKEKKSNQFLNKNVSTLFYFKTLQKLAEKYNQDKKLEQKMHVLQTLIFLIKNSFQINSKKYTQVLFDLFLNYVEQAKYIQALQTSKEFSLDYHWANSYIQSEFKFRMNYEVGKIYYQLGNEDNLVLKYLKNSEFIGKCILRKQDMLSIKTKQMFGNIYLKNKMISQALQSYWQALRILSEIKTKISKQDQFFVIKQITGKFSQLYENNKSNMLDSHIQSKDHILQFFTLIQQRVFISLNQKQNLQLIRLCYFLLKQNPEDQNNLKISFFKIVCNWFHLIIDDIFSFDDELIQLIYSYAQNINVSILNQNYRISILVKQFLAKYYYVKNLKKESLIYSIQVIYLIDHKWKPILIENNDLYFKDQIFERALNLAGFILYFEKFDQESLLFYHELLNIVKKQKNAQFYLKKLSQMADMLYTLEIDEEALPKYNECLKMLQQRNQTDSELYFRIQNVINYITENMTMSSDNFHPQSLSNTINFTQSNNIIFQNQNQNQNKCRIHQIKHQQNHKIVDKYYVKALYMLTLHFFKVQNYDQALKFAQKLILIAENSSDYLIQQFAIYRCIQGRILEKKQRYNEALKDFQYALQILSKLQKHNLNMAQTLFYIGQLHFKYLQPKNSTLYFEKCILTIKKYNKKPNRLYIQALEKLAEANLNLGLQKEAYRKYKECYEICVQLYGKEDNLTKNICQSLEKVGKFHYKLNKNIF